MRKRNLLLATTIWLVGIGGVTGAYVHSTIAEHRNVCGQLYGFPRLLQLVHLIADNGSCVTVPPPQICKDSVACDVTLPCGNIVPGHCGVLGLNCVCMPNATPTPAPTPTPTCTPAPTGMISWWPGDGNANDIQDGNNATASSSVTYGSAIVGLGFQFNPSGSVTSYVEVPNVSNLRPAAVTIDGWVKATSPPGANNYLVSKSFDTCGASYGLYTGGAGGLQFYVRVSPDCLTSSFIVSPDAGKGIWDCNFHHVAGTYDGNVARLYVDGIQIGTGTAGSGAIQYSASYQNGDLLIGNFNLGTGTAFAWPGVIDELDLFNRALSASEIQAMFNAASAGKCRIFAQITSVSRPGSGPSAGHFILTGLTLPNLTLSIQTSPNLTTAFGNFDHVTADGSGVFTYDDAGAVGKTKQFYRATYP